MELKENYHMFDDIPENVVVCINENDNKEIIKQLSKKKCYNIDCSEDWKSKQKKLIDEINGCGCELENCLSFSSDEPNINICTQCKSDFYPIENDQSNFGGYIRCYREARGYYLDNESHLYKKCYYTCETCEISGNDKEHNCLICKNEYQFEINFNNYKNCYEQCNYYHYFDIEKNFHCMNSFSCPDEYPKLIEDKSECVEIDFDYILEDILKLEKNETKLEVEEQIEYYGKQLINFEKIFTSKNYDTAFLDEGKDKIMKTNKMIVTLTTSKNQKNNFNNNISFVDLGECELLLREYYNISENETLYIKKIDFMHDVMKTMKLQKLFLMYIVKYLALI